MTTEHFSAEPWRAVTALTLHADAEHLAANGFGLVIFGALLASRLGPGVAVFVAVVGGALGNALDAWLLAPPTPWVGASTAVFALLGALAASLRSPLLLALGALVTWLAHGAMVNTGAHALGLVAGIALSGLLNLTLADTDHGDDDHVPFSGPPQLAAAGLTIAFVAGCWAFAASSLALP